MADFIILWIYIYYEPPNLNNPPLLKIENITGNFLSLYMQGHWFIRLTDLNGNCNVCGKIYLTNRSDLQMIYSLRNNTILKDNVADWHSFKPL